MGDQGTAKTGGQTGGKPASKAGGAGGSRKAPRLGRGLSALVGPAAPVRVERASAVSLDTEQNANISIHNTTLDIALIMAPVDSVRPNPNQPRRVFDGRSLESLADSIRADGVMQPIVVRRVGEGYELVAGERRLRASRLAGLTEIPAIVREVDDRASAELALIENLQRADLNPVERAQAFRALIDRHGLTQARLGERLGMDRTSVTNHLRLLDLGEDILNLIATGVLGFAHGRALAGVSNAGERAGLALAAVEHGWSARRLEREVAESSGSAPGVGATNTRPTGPHISPVDDHDADAPTRARAVLDDMEKRMGEHLGTRVALKTDRSGQSGTVTISFFSLDEFDAILERLGCRFAGE